MDRFNRDSSLLPINHVFWYVYCFKNNSPLSFDLLINYGVASYKMIFSLALFLRPYLSKFHFPNTIQMIAKFYSEAFYIYYSIPFLENPSENSFFLPFIIQNLKLNLYEKRKILAIYPNFSI